MYATVITASKQAGIGNGLTYGVGSGLELGLGSLVRIPLRKMTVEGIVVDVSDKKPIGEFEVKEIVEVLRTTLLSESQIGLAKWIAEYYCCTLRQALTGFLPGVPWSALLPKEEEWVKIIARSAQHDTILHSPTLTPRQIAAYKAIKADPRPTLLFGVTGSGKTEIYAALIEETLKEGKNTILLLPEILLTENFLERFEQLVPKKKMAVVHSRLTLAKRREAWRRCASGAVRFVLGSRSALFYPLQNLGLIIIDEEHEWTYKNEQAPKYHAVKVAEQIGLGLGFGGKVKLILGSATPSIESWYKAKNGHYQLVELPERYGNAELPAVRVIDLAEVKFGNHYPLSPALLEAIRMRLVRHEQSILFLNRRGFATNLLCKKCRYRFEDPETKLPYTVHYRVGVRPYTREQPYLLSHHTGEKLPIPDVCPQCGSRELLELGAGTQRIETLLSELFPEARILRADADTLRSPEQMRILLAKMREERADILLGTQSVVKGLDLPKVTLAAVLLADVGLSLPHFRAGERVFQLLTQLTGRSGRNQRGEVIIQTFRPKAVEVAFAADHDVRGYLEGELLMRKKAHYPPDTELLRMLFSGKTAAEQSLQYASQLKAERAIHVSRSPTLFSGGKEWQVLIRGKDVRGTLKTMPKFDVMIDVDPVECL